MQLQDNQVLDGGLIHKTSLPVTAKPTSFFTSNISLKKKNWVKNHKNKITEERMKEEAHLHFKFIIMIDLFVSTCIPLTSTEN